MFRVRYDDAIGKRDVSQRAVFAITPKATRSFERDLRQMLALEMRRQSLPIFTRPVLVGVRATFMGDETLGAISQRVGDLDNIEKCVLDAMNGTVFTDDRLVVCKFSQKAFAPEPSPTITVAEAQACAVRMSRFEEILSALTRAATPDPGCKKR